MRLYNVYSSDRATDRRLRVAEAVSFGEASELANRYSKSAHKTDVDIVPIDEDPEYFDEDGYLDGIDYRR